MSGSLFQRRLLVIIILLGIFGLLIVLQYAAIMVGGPFKSSVVKTPHFVERGTILDRNSRLLALQTVVYTLSAWVPNLEDPYTSAVLLGKELGIDQESLYKKMIESKGSVILQSGLSQEKADTVQALIDEGKLPGIYLEPNSSRIYPEGSAAAQVIGFTGTDNRGLEGIEYVFDDELAKEDVIMPDGRAYGNQVFLTIDMNIQQAFEKIADKTLAEHRPEGLIYLALDAVSGEVLAYVLRPSFNPNAYKTSTGTERKNLALSFTYEPGSVFKIFTLSGIMNGGGIGPNTSFDTSKGYHNKRFRDPITDLANYGTLNVEGIIKYSSNVGAAFSSDSLDDESFYRMIKSFGFGEKTGLELHGEEQGLLKNPDTWSPRTKPTMAFGQELGVTAMQMISAATVLANDGTLLRPHLVKRIVSPSGEVIKETGREVVRQVLKPETARLMRTYMNAATEDSGTGRRSRIEGINLSVKTGTAQMIDPAKGRYSDTDFIASSLALFPTEAPQIILYVVLIKPRGNSFYGGRIAAPLIKEGAEFLIPYLGIQREGDRVVLQNQELRLSLPKLPEFTDTLPDFRGLPLKTVMQLYSRDDMSLEISGSGFVKEQYPGPGSPFAPGLKLRLVLDN